MVLDLPADPNLKDLQLPFEWRYHRNRNTWISYSLFYRQLMKFFGEERKPRDIFRSDVADYRTWLRKKGYADGSVNVRMQVGNSFFKFLNEIEVVEDGHNPFKGMMPRRIRIQPK